MIDPARIHSLRAGPPGPGRFVLYWMQQAQRAWANPALEHALARANALDLPLVAVFCLDPDYPEANARHFAFLLEGLAETAADLERRGIRFLLRRGDPPTLIPSLAAEAAALVCDRGYLRHQRQWRRRVAAGVPCPVDEVETDAVVPVEVASGRAETAARTLRPKLHRVWNRFLEPPEQEPVRVPAQGLPLASDADPSDPARLLAELPVDRSVAPVAAFPGGYREARRRLDAFLAGGLTGYATQSSDPVAEPTSHLSPYLHFGQIAPQEVGAAVRAAAAPEADRAAYLEQLVVRRELAINHCWFRPDDYDHFAGLPDWARRTLADHAADPRRPCYPPERLEAAETADPYWNAAMTDMRHRGWLPGYLRMYWGKKILEWSPTPEDAFVTALSLNNRYFLDGRDANAFTNVAWCFGLHDRGWPERPIYGKVRYMNAAGLRRKFRIDDYVRKVLGTAPGEET